MLHLICNAHVFSPHDVGIVHLLIAAGKVAYLGKNKPQISKDLLTTETDLEGARLIPGLIDAHTHITGGGGEAGFRTRVPPVPLSQFTAAGVTSVVGLLGTDDTARTTSALIAQTYALREEGLNAWCYTGGYHYPLTTLTGSARSDIVHIDCVIGVGEMAISDHRSSQPTFEEVIRVASDAHVAGLMTGKAGIVHFHLGDGARGLSLVERALEETELPARVFNPTHVNRKKALFEQACLLAEKGVTIDLTAFPVADDEDAWSAANGWLRYHDKGGADNRITISSDGGGCFPVFDDQGGIAGLDYGKPIALIKTLSELLERGVPLQKALKPMTSNQAELLKLTHKGRIGQGADADLVVLDETHRVRDVMINGNWHLQNHTPLRKGTFES